MTHTRTTELLAGPTWFDRFAEASTRIASRATFFGVSLVVVLLWLPTIALFESVDTWQLVINTATSVLAFLLVALLQNSERRPAGPGAAPQGGRDRRGAGGADGRRPRGGAAARRRAARRPPVRRLRPSRAPT